MNTKFFIAILLVLAAAFSAIGWWANGRYADIKTVVLEEKKKSISTFMDGRTRALLPDEALLNPDYARQAATFKNFWAKIQSPEIVRIKIWSKDYTVVWSDNREIIGERYPDNHEVEEALEGEVEIELADSSEAEGISERQFMALNEIYVPIRGQSGDIIAVAELYEPAVLINRDIQAAFRSKVLPLAAGLALVSLALAGAAFAVLRKRAA